MREQQETPKDEAQHHSKRFLKSAAKMAGRKGGKRKMKRSSGGR